MASTFPIRCFTCGKEINSSYKRWRKGLKRGEEPGVVLDKLRMERMCCRRMFMGHGGEAVNNCMFKYAAASQTPDDRIIEVGVRSTTFKDTRDAVRKIIGEVSDDDGSEE